MTLRPIVFDMYHGDASREVHGKLEDLVDYDEVYAKGWRAVYHKATEGLEVDPLYHTRKQKALDAGLLWGAYHFMRPGDVGAQVSKFLDVVGVSRQPDTRMILDYEDERLSLWQAIRWCESVRTITGQSPWIYGGGLIKTQVDRGGPPPALAQFPLILAEYSEVAKIPRPWTKFILWQRSGDGIGPGPHNIPGIGVKEDVDWFDGTDDELKAVWLDQPLEATA